MTLTVGHGGEQKSKIGTALNKVRKCDEQEVQKAATATLHKWKDVMVPVKSESGEGGCCASN